MCINHLEMIFFFKVLGDNRINAVCCNGDVLVLSHSARKLFKY